MLSRNEKRAADGRSKPRKTPAAMVEPDRLRPGAMARAWKQPTMSASAARILSSPTGSRPHPAQSEVGAPQQQAGDDQEDAHRQGAVEEALEEAGEEEAGYRRPGSSR